MSSGFRFHSPDPRQDLREETLRGVFAHWQVIRTPQVSNRMSTRNLGATHFFDIKIPWCLVCCCVLKNLILQVMFETKTTLQVCLRALLFWLKRHVGFAMFFEHIAVVLCFVIFPATDSFSGAVACPSVGFSKLCWPLVYRFFTLVCFSSKKCQE